jgi:hypothetical protein
MTEEQKAAFVMGQVACAQAKIAGMQAQNMQRSYLGHPMEYTASDFENIVTEFKIGWNDVIEFFGS